MPDFKIKWVNHDVDPLEGGSIRTILTKVYSASNEDEALDLWEKEYPVSAEYGAEACFQTVDHPLLKKHFAINMPDGFTYAIPVELIARNHAAHFAKTQANNDEIQILTEVTIPEFSQSNHSIHEWAATRLTWEEVKEHSLIIKRHKLEKQMENAWLDLNTEIEII